MLRWYCELPQGLKGDAIHKSKGREIDSSGGGGSECSKNGKTQMEMG